MAKITKKIFLILLLISAASALHAQVEASDSIPVANIAIDTAAANVSTDTSVSRVVSDTVAAGLLMDRAVFNEALDTVAASDTVPAVASEDIDKKALSEIVSTIGCPSGSKLEKEKRRFDMPRLMGGLRFGVNYADMLYSYESMECYDHHLRPNYMAGLFLQIPLGRSPLMIRPEFTVLTRGDSLTWLDVNYGITAKYFDVRLPITLSLRLGKNNVSPYLMVAPQFNVVYGGVIGYTAEDYSTRTTVPVTKAVISPYDAGVLLGAGIDFKIPTVKMPIYISVEGGYNIGLLNNFAPREMAGGGGNQSAIANNFYGAELWRGDRYNRGIEIAMRVSLPLDYDFMARYRESLKVKADTVELVNWRTDTLIRTDSVYVTGGMPSIKLSHVSYVTKECFTIAELYELMEHESDITGKRICMFDIKFDFGSYKIRPESEEPLNELVMMMQEYPQMTIEVYGHTDSIGSEEYNQKLSENRAQAVVDYISNHGISPSRIRSFGYGLRYPIDTNSTEEGRFRNRRVEFDVITIGIKRRYDN